MEEPTKDMNAWGPENPHPLSRLKTELVWEGKYDEYGKRRPVRLPSSPLPLRRIESIDGPYDREKAGQRGRPGEDAFDRRPRRDDFRNLLIWGDNKLALAALLERFRGQVDLIYTDPPFDVGADFTLQVQVGDDGETVRKGHSLMEALAYRDTWGRGTDSYLHMMYERLALMRELLNPRGSLFLHCDWHVNSMLRSILEDVFGKGGYRNEIVWYYYNKFQGNVGQFAANHDVIYWFSKGPDFYFAPIKEEREQPVKQLKRGWDKQKGRIVNVKDAAGKVQYIESAERTVDDVWRISMLQPADKTENVGYTTQKPEALAERIMLACSREGDLVADFFCGSGTTLAVAEKLGRRWIGVDLGRHAVHTTRKRLIQVQRERHAANKPYRAFDVYTLGRYERQWWQMERLQGADTEHRSLVLQFYKAAPLEPPASPLLHGKKGSAYVHVDRVDSLFSFDELGAAAAAAQASGGRELHCLAWEFEMELARRKQVIEAETGVTIRLKYIPREIMEPNCREAQFFEPGLLEAVAVRYGKGVDVRLTRFSPSLVEAPEKEMAALRERAVTSPFDFIDFWAVDFLYQHDKPFEHHWQDFRTRKDRRLKTQTDLGWAYDAPGHKQICVKVIDVFGVDTTIVIETGDL